MNKSTCIFCDKETENNSFFCSNCNKEFIESDFLDNPIKVPEKETRTINIDHRIRELKKEIYVLAEEKSKVELYELHPLVKNPEYDIYQVKCRKRVVRMYIISALCIFLYIIVPIIFDMFNIDLYLIFNGFLLLIFQGFMVLFMFFVMCMTGYKNEKFMPSMTLLDEQKRNSALSRLDYIDGQIQDLKEKIEELKKIK